MAKDYQDTESSMRLHALRQQAQEVAEALKAAEAEAAAKQAERETDS